MQDRRTRDLDTRRQLLHDPVENVIQWLEIGILPDNQHPGHGSDPYAVFVGSRRPVRRKSESVYSLRQVSRAAASSLRIRAPSLVDSTIRIDAAGCCNSSSNAFEWVTMIK